MFAELIPSRKATKVAFGGAHSMALQVKHGVPQSSTTTVPLFFMVPINDLDFFRTSLCLLTTPSF